MRTPARGYGPERSVAAALAVGLGLALGLGGAAAASGCAEPRAPAPVTATAAAPFALPPFAADVAAVRGLAFARPITLEEVPRAKFRTVLREQVTEVDAHRVEMMKAFGFAHPLAMASEAAEIRLLSEQHVGLYLPERRAVVVRQKVPGEPAREDEGPIVHELVHALQDDHYPLRELQKAASLDERLARRAVLEGDAELTAALVRARRAGRSDESALAELDANAVVEAAARRFMTGLDGAPELSRASSLVRAELAFPYGAGTRFVIRLYRTGGMALVDRVYNALPTSTEQVLHPEKYVAGEAPVPVTAPAAPPGYRALSSGNLGELGASALLALALPPEEALPAAAGWGGDAYTVVQHEATRRLAVLWTTAWDDDAQAARFDAALRKATSCGRVGRPCLVGPVVQERRGRVVVWSRGLDEGEAVLRPLFALAGAAPPPKPPLGPVQLATTEAKTPSGKAPAMDARRRVRLPRAGIRLVVPRGFAPKPSDEDDLVLGQTGGAATATVSMIVEPFGDRATEALRASVAASLGSSIAPGARASAEPDRFVDTPLGRGRELRWQLEGESRVTMSFVMLPRCGGVATLLVTRVAVDDASTTALERWLATFEEAGAPSACRETKAR